MQAKGLEFRAVAVMACDDEVLPLQVHGADGELPAHRLDVLALI